jgi:hypothetical protein
VQLAQLQYKLDDSILTQRALHIRIGEVDTRVAIDRAAQQLKPRVEVPGFRKGKAPLARVRTHHRARIEAMAFSELKSAALEQVFKQLEAKDKPFLPPEVVEPESVRLRYGKELEFQVRYMVDPSGIGSRPEQAGEHFDPLREIHSRVATGLPQGIPGGPKLPAVPNVPSAPGMPQLPPQAQQLLSPSTKGK